jgi:citrate lyase beta subunit
VGRLAEAVFADLDRRLAATDAMLRARYPGEPVDRQPVHTVYVPADRYHAGLVPRWAARARAALAAHASTAADLGVTPDVYDRMRAKLDREPIEDLRIDFEDGYGHRSDAEEDETARIAAMALLDSLASGTAAPFAGLRVKSLEAATRRRAVRTLDVFLEALGAPPPGFVVTLPKVSAVDQVAAMVALCERLEEVHGLRSALRFEVQVETPAAILGADGAATVARMIGVADGRCAGLHFGTYDYSAACGIAAQYQSLAHPAADHAKAVMQVAAAGTGVRLVDGSTNVLPVGDREAVHAAWRLHSELVRRALERGFYQGWDLHPAQLPTRYTATYGFYRDGLAQARRRLDDYRDRLAGAVLDEPATARALTGFLRRRLSCGAFDEAEVA